jgi:hypothetical protein
VAWNEFRRGLGRERGITYGRPSLDDSYVAVYELCYSLTGSVACSLQLVIRCLVPGVNDVVLGLRRA